MLLAQIVLFQSLSTPLYAASVVAETTDNVTRARAMAAAVNQARAAAGLSHYTLNPLLSVAAQSHAQEMAAHHNYSHYGLDGSSVAKRVRRTGYAAKQGVSENWVAAGSISAAMGWWMNSSVHRANILSGKWREVGVGSGIDPSNDMEIYVLVFSGGGELTSPVIAAAQTPRTSDPQATRTHTVQAGESLAAIAARYGLRWQTLATYNGMGDKEVLQIGRVLRLTAGFQSNAPSTGGATSEVTWYTVRTGDTLSTIASQYGTSWQNLVTLNQLSDSALLQIGQVIYVPVRVKSAAQTLPSAEALPDWHTIQSGETVLSIALEYGLNWQELLELNGLDEDTLIQIGQPLRLR